MTLEKRYFQVFDKTFFADLIPFTVISLRFHFKLDKHNYELQRTAYFINQQMEGHNALKADIFVIIIVEFKSRSLNFYLASDKL